MLVGWKEGRKIFPPRAHFPFPPACKPDKSTQRLSGAAVSLFVFQSLSLLRVQIATTTVSSGLKREARDSFVSFSFSLAPAVAATSLVPIGTPLLVQAG